MLPKGISNSQALEARIRLYESVIKTASSTGLSKDGVPIIAEKLWEKIIEPLVEVKKPNAEGPATS